MTAALAIVFTLILVGCTAAGTLGTSSPAAASSKESVGPGESSPPTQRPTEEPLRSDLDPALVHAIEMRRGAGLRHDLAYVIAAQTDPRARIYLLDFPLYREEERLLIAAMAEQDAIVAIVELYARDFSAEYGGLYIDREDRPGFVTALWTRNVTEHEAAIRDMIGDRRMFAVRRVPYSEAELRAIQDRIAKDLRAAWVAEIPADLQTLGVHIRQNVVSVEVSSANPDAVAIIEEHYNLGNRLQVRSDGTGAALLPWGTVRGKVVGPDGEALRGEQDGTEPLSLTLNEVGETPGECGGGDVGYGVDGLGRFVFPCQVGRRTIVILAEGGEGLADREVGRAIVEVEADETVRVTIRLTEVP